MKVVLGELPGSRPAYPEMSKSGYPSVQIIQAVLTPAIPEGGEESLLSGLSGKFLISFAVEAGTDGNHKLGTEFADKIDGDGLVAARARSGPKIGSGSTSILLLLEASNLRKSWSSLPTHNLRALS